jgi:hypothetical protein
VNKLIRASVIASVLTAAGIIANTTNAFAADQVVNFQGNVPATCTFSNVVNGTLGIAAPDQLSEAGAGGAAGSVDLTCNSNAQVSVSLPVDNGSSPAITPTFAYAGAATSAGTATNDTGAGSVPVNVTGPIQETLSVGMYVVNGGVPIPAGTYNYNVTVTATAG